jgi:hypothetical protein
MGMNWEWMIEPMGQITQNNHDESEIYDQDSLFDDKLGNKFR